MEEKEFQEQGTGDFRNMEAEVLRTQRQVSSPGLNQRDEEEPRGCFRRGNTCLSSGKEKRCANRGKTFSARQPISENLKGIR